MARRKKAAPQLRKVATGFDGFDAVTGGGLPDGRVSVIAGGAGTGKSVFALQALLHAVRTGKRAGVYVSFEENPDSIPKNVAAFGWGLHEMLGRTVFLLDGRPDPDAVQSGRFDIGGLLALAEGIVRKHGAAYLVLDGIDALLGMLPSDLDRRREFARLQAWIERTALTTIVTIKHQAAISTFEDIAVYMADCVVELQRTSTDAISRRSLRILKYRGSGHTQNWVPYVIGRGGIEIDPVQGHSGGFKVYSTRVSTGIADLDAMLRGGYFRASTTLLSGAPGTLKTTLASRFAEAACQRREKCLYVCFDEAPDEIVRNMTSVNTRLAPHVAAGRLRMEGRVARSSSADLLASGVMTGMEEFRPHCLVLDPVSAFAASGDVQAAHDAVRLIIQHGKQAGVTMLLTSLIDAVDGNAELSKAHVSTLCDNWLHVSYVINAGERNRALTIVKSRGTGHSNQVRELILGNEGVRLESVYTEQGEVLMGTMRWQREQHSRLESQQMQRHAQRRQRQTTLEAEALAARIRALEEELTDKRQDLEEIHDQHESSERHEGERRVTLAGLRSTDSSRPAGARTRRRKARGP